MPNPGTNITANPRTHPRTNLTAAANRMEWGACDDRLHVRGARLRRRRALVVRRRKV